MKRREKRGGRREGGWRVDFAAIPVFFSDRHSTLQSGSSIQDHRHMKMRSELHFTKFKTKLQCDSDSGTIWPTFSSSFQCNC